MSEIQTVTGPISPDKLGVTSPHEHLWLDLTPHWYEPKDPARLPLVDAPLSIENLEVIRRDLHISKDNLKYNDKRVATEELRFFKENGGNSIVEVTCKDNGRNPAALVDISKETGVNVIMATGWYQHWYNPPYVERKSAEDLCEIMVRELTEGVDETGVRAGVLKCAMSCPLHDNEKKVLIAEGLAQRETGAPMTIHPGLEMDLETKTFPCAKAHVDYLDLLIEHGANLEKIYMSHMDHTDLDYQKLLMDEYGVCLCYDWGYAGLGYETRYGPIDTEADETEQIAAIAQLCREGYAEKIMLSQDICYKVSLTKYGGQGYAHILKNVVPALKSSGVTDKQIRTILVGNPKRILSY
jgi:phosphotriesterase-related protein